MEVVLDKDDIKTLIMDSYDGVNEVKFGKDSPKVTLDVDLKEFALKSKNESQKQTTSQQSKDGLTTEQRLEMTKQPGGIKAARGEDAPEPEVSEEQQKTVEEMQEERRKRLENSGKIMSSGRNERNRVMREF